MDNSYSSREGITTQMCDQDDPFVEPLELLRVQLIARHLGPLRFPLQELDSLEKYHAELQAEDPETAFVLVECVS